MRKILYTCLVALLLMGALPVRGQNASIPELVDGYYQIGNAEQLKWFRDQVNSSTEIDPEYADIGEDFTISRLNAKLVADIDLSGTGSWTPIGNYNTGIRNHEYAGTFDGQGHVISGLTVNEISGRISYGLFGYVWRGTVKNLGIVNSTIKGTEYVGSICGMLGNGTIDNCFSTATVIATADGARVGGLSGGLRKTSFIRNTYNAGIVTATGSGSDTTGNPSVGGISGYIGSESLVINCYNAGLISAACENAKIGSITGDNYSEQYTYSQTKALEEGTVGISNCYYLKGIVSDDQVKTLSAPDFVTMINSDLFGVNDYWQGTASFSNSMLLIPTFQEGNLVQVTVSSDDPTAVDKVSDAANNVRVIDGRVCIITSDPVNMRIVSITGRTVRTGRLAAGTSEVSGLPGGVYIVLLDNGIRSKVLIR